MKTIENIPGKNPFKVPDNYFEEVNRKIISSTAGIKPVAKNGGIIRRIRPYLLAAASVTGFMILSYFATRYFAANRYDSASDEISVIRSVEPFINDIDIFALEDNAAAIELPDKLSGINSSVIIDCLMLENIEINDIYEIL